MKEEEEEEEEEEEFHRLLIQDKTNLYRILRFGIFRYKKKEPYVKISFPWTKGRRTLLLDKTRPIPNIRPEEATERNVPLIEYPGLTDFSYHFINGVSHFKAKGKDRIYQIKNQLKISENLPIHLLRMWIFDLDEINPFLNELDDIDFILPEEFSSNKGRILDFFLSPKSMKPKQQLSDNEELVGYYFFMDENLEFRLTIIDRKWKKKPDNYGIKIYRPDDPRKVLSENNQLTSSLFQQT